MSHTASTGAYQNFEGRIGRTVAGSDAWWPPEAAAPKGAPNVIVIMADDLGYSDLGCYGSEIATPNLDELAAGALRFSNYHATPMCSPTRAALLTGVNSHLAGVGHVAHSDAGFPGYAMELADDVASAAEIFSDAGYFTAMVGKWHLTKDSHCSDAGPFDSWPVQRGFDRFYGFLDGFTNLHHPHRLIDGNSPVTVDTYPEGYYLTDDLTDRAVEMLQGAKASNPAKPFFLYFSHGSVHAPLHAKPADLIAKAKGFYPAANFDASLAYVNKRIDATNEALASNAAILIQDKATAESHNDAYNRGDQEAVEMAKALPKQFSQPVVDAYASATADLVSRYDSLRSDAASNDAYLREYLGQD